MSHTRIYKWNPIDLLWAQLGGDIHGDSAGNWSGYSIALDADGTKIAIGSPLHNNNLSDIGHVRIFELCNTISLNNEQYKLKLIN